MTAKQVGEFHNLVVAWSVKNFGDSQPHTNHLLGLVEECGELARAELKTCQRVRGTPNIHRAAATDAVGDLFLFLCGVVNNERMSWASILDQPTSQVAAQSRVTAIIELSRAISCLLQQPTEISVKVVFESLIRAAESLDITLEECVRTAWEEIRDRDWKSPGVIIVNALRVGQTTGVFVKHKEAQLLVLEGLVNGNWKGHEKAVSYLVEVGGHLQLPLEHQLELVRMAQNTA